MNILSKILLVIFNSISAVINPEFMQVGQVTITSASNANATQEITYPYAFKNLPQIYTSLNTSNSRAWGVSGHSINPTKAIISLSLTIAVTPSMNIPINWIAIDVTQPVLKLSRGNA